MDPKTKDQLEDYRHYKETVGELPWRAWGSWFSWGSPIGLSIFLLSLAGIVVLLHLAGLY